MLHPEILAPAGSPETLLAALRSGADAVYAGGKKFSARSSASNFSNDELADAVRLCHKYGAKLDLAVNTIISDDEAEDFCDYIKYTASIGVDAYIVQDWGCAYLIKRCVPDAVLHASTQMSVHTAAASAMLMNEGYARVVPARELSRDVLKKIASLGIETEVFVHGALCMSVSGQCYISAVMGSRSANRGCCGQACRLPFSADSSKNHAALSLKDLSLLEHASELADIGIDSLKIEGRMKRPEYVASAVNELNKAFCGQSPDLAMLRGVFSRGGFTDGYFTGKRLDMFGVREKDDVTAAKDIIPGLHELYRFERSVYTININAVIKKGEPVLITASCGDISASVQGDIPEKALNRPTDCDMLRKQLSKLGDTVFSLGELNCELDSGLIVPAGVLNHLRRQLTDELTELVIRKNTPEHDISGYAPQLPEWKDHSANGKMPLRTLCRRKEQLSPAAELSQFIIIPEKLAEDALDAGISCDKIIIAPPRFIVDEDALRARLGELKNAGFKRLFCHTSDCIAIGRELGFMLHGSFTLNLFNSYSALRLHELGLEDCAVSFEARLSQIEHIHSPMPLGAVICGRLPLMLTRNCPVNAQLGCKNCTGHLIDRTGRTLPVACSGDYVEILNSDTLYMLDKLGEFRNTAFGIVLLNDEDASQTKALLSGKRPDTSLTKGLYYRGII